MGGLIFDRAGNLYGTTAGATTGAGTVFELTPSSGGGWTESILHTFAGYSSDGACPAGGVNFDAEGDILGITNVGGAGGGSGNSCQPYGYWPGVGGAVFEITP
jgi:hypothetical protein